MARSADRHIGPTITASVVQSLCGALSHHTTQIDAGLRNFGLISVMSGDPGQRVPLENYLGLFEWLSRELGDRCLGLDLSQRTGPEMLGAVGYLFLSSANLESALRNLVRYIRAIQDATLVDLAVDQGYVKLSYRVVDDAIGERSQDSEYSQGFNWRMIQLFSGRSVPLVQVDFEHDQLGNSAHYRRIFKAPVLFGQATNTLYLRHDQLQASSKVSDPNLLPFLEAYVRDAVAQQANKLGFVDRVNMCLNDEVLRAGPRAKLVANRLALSEVTLHRRLNAEGYSFKQLVDKKCKAIATRMIAQETIAISTVARRLGYAEPACFTRAFRRWYAMTPTQYRRKIGHHRHGEKKSN